jgi:hypothetical protein
VPGNPDDLKGAVVSWLETHARDLQTIGAHAGRSMAHILVGLVVGAMVSRLGVRPRVSDRPLARALVERVTRLGNAFRRIVFAQIRISALNTVLTGLFLIVGLPLCYAYLKDELTARELV